MFHTFHDEVDSYRTHVWQCDGPCRDRPPYFGLVKRSMNRAPGKGDSWWAAHEAECGGTYTKIQEPELTKKQKDALSKKERAGLQKNKLDAWVKVGPKKEGERSNADAKSSLRTNEGTISGSVGPSGKRKIETIVLDDIVERSDTKRSKSGSRETNTSGDDVHLIATVVDLVECPICNQAVAQSNINEHLDQVHPP